MVRRLRSGPVAAPPTGHSTPVRRGHRRQHRQLPARRAATGTSTCSTACTATSPDSGDPTRYEGVMDDVAPQDPYYWHPASGFGAPSSTYGFPTVPRPARRRPPAVPAPPGSACPGSPPTATTTASSRAPSRDSPLFAQLAVGAGQAHQPPAGRSSTAGLGAQLHVRRQKLLAQDPATVGHRCSPTAASGWSPPDARPPDRRPGHHGGRSTSRPRAPRCGHGFTAPQRPTRTALPTTPSPPATVLGVVLDTVVSAGGPDGVRRPHPARLAGAAVCSP